MSTTAGHLERLAETLTALSSDEKKRLLALVADRTHGQPERRYLPWSNLRAIRGVLHLGGNAVDDCNRLYNG